MHLFHRVVGQGEPIIIIHGLLGASDNWNGLSKKIASNGYTVFSIDNRNHGRSPNTPNFDYSLMVNDLYSFMTNQHIYKAHVIGHSMGGKVAMHFALEYPDMVNKLIVIDIAPVDYEHTHNEVFNALRSIDLSTVQHRQEVDVALEKAGLETFAVRQLMLKALYKNEQGIYNWRFNVESLYQNYPKIAQGIDCEEVFERPTLFIKGGASNYILDAYLPDIKRYFPNYRLNTFEGIGHWVQAENPSLFLKTVTDFLSS